jgi:hypothetical protein
MNELSDVLSICVVIIEDSTGNTPCSVVNFIAPEINGD